MISFLKSNKKRWEKIFAALMTKELASKIHNSDRLIK